MNNAANWILVYVSSKQSCLYFILQWQFSLFDFSSILVILSRTNVDCVLLPSMLNSILVLLEKLSQYIATVIIRGVFRIYETWWNFLSKYVTAFTSIIPFWQGHEFASDHDTVFSSNQNSLQILVFLENCNKKGDMSYDFTFS